MLDYLTKENIGQKKVNFKFREWIFARQRYWGEPIPVIHYEDGTIGVLDDEDLPLVLPEMDDYKGRGGCVDLATNTETYFVYPLNNSKALTKIHFANEIIYDLQKEGLKK